MLGFIKTASMLGCVFFAVLFICSYMGNINPKTRLRFAISTALLALNLFLVIPLWQGKPITQITSDPQLVYNEDGTIKHDRHGDYVIDYNFGEEVVGREKPLDSLGIFSLLLFISGIGVSAYSFVTHVNRTNALNVIKNKQEGDITRNMIALYLKYADGDEYINPQETFRERFMPFYQGDVEFIKCKAAFDKYFTFFNPMDSGNWNDDDIQQYFKLVKEYFGNSPIGELPSKYKNVVVELTEAGKETVEVIKIVREITGLGLSEARDFVLNTPQLLKDAASKDEAATIKAKLEKVGATVTCNTK